VRRSSVSFGCGESARWPPMDWLWCPAAMGQKKRVRGASSVIN